MAFNDLLQQVGGVGRFQQIQVTLCILPLLLVFLQNLLQNFTAATPSHHCRPPANTNLSQDGGLGQPESCLRVTSPQRGVPSANGTETHITGAVEPCTEGWTYDNTTFLSTIVTEWDLVCTHKTLPQLSQSMFMAGLVIGSLAFGILSDRLGRQKLLTWTYLQLAVSGSCAAFAPNFSTYCTCRFFSGMAVNGINSNSMTLVMEWLPIHVRPRLGLVFGFVPSLSQLILAGLAYAMRQWRHLQLMVSLPFFVFFIYSIFFIESALWYACSGRMDLTLKTLERVARINGKQKEGEKLSMEVLQDNLQKDLAMNQAQPSMLQLLRYPAIRRLSLYLLPLCSTLFFSFYGMVMSLQTLGMDIYLIQVLFAAVDLPFHFLTFLSTRSLGRRLTQMGSMLLSGVCILACALVPAEHLILRITMAVLGKGCTFASFNCIIVYTGELYPTVMRQRGLSIMMTWANIGSILSPLVAMMAELYPSLPLFMYGIMPMAASTITLFLPETMGQPLPNTVQDLENSWKEKRRRRRRWEQQEQQMVSLRPQHKRRMDAED